MYVLSIKYFTETITLLYYTRLIALEVSRDSQGFVRGSLATSSIKVLNDGGHMDEEKEDEKPSSIKYLLAFT